ncbi:hypothetical protein BN871_AZ_00170 [Paenibacillus sp. P22]|nr:hypothetical protein BN871_AZ_00170 [Paenibacillus sp. P22]
MEEGALSAAQPPHDRAGHAAVLHPLRAPAAAGRGAAAGRHAWSHRCGEPRAVRGAAERAARFVRRHHGSARFWSGDGLPGRKHRCGRLQPDARPGPMDAVADVQLGHDRLHSGTAEAYPLHGKPLGPRGVRLRLGLSVRLDHESMVPARILRPAELAGFRVGLCGQLLFRSRPCALQRVLSDAVFRHLAEHIGPGEAKVRPAGKRTGRITWSRKHESPVLFNSFDKKPEAQGSQAALRLLPFPLPPPRKKKCRTEGGVVYKRAGRSVIGQGREAHGGAEDARSA